MIAAFCPQLDTLYMRRCPELSDLGIQVYTVVIHHLRFVKYSMLFNP